MFKIFPHKMKTYENCNYTNFFIFFGFFLDTNVLNSTTELWLNSSDEVANRSNYDQSTPLPSIRPPTTSSSAGTSSTTHRSIHGDQPNDLVEYVKPSKIHVKPLHADDLLYESKRIATEAGMRAINIIYNVVSGTCVKNYVLYVWGGTGHHGFDEPLKNISLFH